MKNLIKNFYLIERKNIKFKVMLGLIAFFIISTFIFLNQSDFRELKPKTASELLSINAALEQFQNVDASDPERATPIYQNILKQSRELTRRNLALSLEKQELYIESSLALHELREEATQMGGYEDVAIFLPDNHQMYLDYTLMESLEEEDKMLLANNDNFPTYIILLFLALGYGWYLLVAIFSSDILLDEEHHSSVVKGYPYTVATKLLAKTLFYILVVISLLLLTVAISVLSAGIQFGFDFTYPIAIFNTTFFTIPVWKFIVLSTFYLMLLSVFAISVSILLNYYVKNLYFVIFIHFLLFFFINITGENSQYTWFLPFQFLNYSAISTGQVADLTNVLSNNISYGFIILSLFILFIFAFIYVRVKWGKVKSN